MLFYIEDLFIMGVRLVPEICSAILYHRGFWMTHVCVTHACPDWQSVCLLHSVVDGVLSRVLVVR